MNGTSYGQNTCKVTSYPVKLDPRRQNTLRTTSKKCITSEKTNDSTAADSLSSTDRRSETPMSFNPNSNSFVPGGAATPPFQPGQPYQQPSQQQGAPGQNPYAQGQYYDQYQQQQNQGGYGGYQQQQGGYNPYGGGYQQQQQNYYDPNQQQQYNPYAVPPVVEQTTAYVPPVAKASFVPTIPYVRPKTDDSAPAPARAPTMSLKIGGAASAAPAVAAAPASVSLKIGAAKTPASAASSKNPTPGGSKVVTPSSSKPATPAPGEKATKEKTVGGAAKGDKEAAASGKTSTEALLTEVKSSVDEETLADLYGQDDEAIKAIKPHLNIVFIGHVDAGKSTMGGNLLFLTGMVDKRTMEKYEREAKEAGRESWYLSWALDSTAQEREKGKTVEVGRAYFETPVRRYTILDAPGHKNFVPSMISGAAQADTAVLVISARKGEFETGFEKGGQSREHAMLVKTAGVTKLIVVVNKMDDPTVNWDKARYDEIQGKMLPFLKGTGYNLKTDVVFIPVSGYTGANLKEPVDRAIAPWVEGPSLLQYLDAMPILDRKNNAPLMMPISEKYSDMGTVVVGKVESGHVKKGQSLLLMPNKSAVVVAAIHNEMEEEVPMAVCGDNVRIRLRGVEDEEIGIGFVLTSVEAPVHAVTHFEAQLVILDHKNIICAGYSAVMHVHTLAEEINLSALLHYYDKKTGKKSRKPPQFAKKGQKIIALIEAAAPVCIERFADHPQLGRFTIRDEGKTIAIGKVTKLITSVVDLPDLAKLDLENGA